MLLTLELVRELREEFFFWIYFPCFGNTLKVIEDELRMRGHDKPAGMYLTIIWNAHQVLIRQLYRSQLFWLVTIKHLKRLHSTSNWNNFEIFLRKIDGARLKRRKHFNNRRESLLRDLTLFIFSDFSQNKKDGKSLVQYEKSSKLSYFLQISQPLSISSRPISPTPTQLRVFTLAAFN